MNCHIEDGHAGLKVSWKMDSSISEHSCDFSQLLTIDWRQCTIIETQDYKLLVG